MLHRTPFFPSGGCWLSHRWQLCGRLAVAMFVITGRVTWTCLKRWYWAPLPRLDLTTNAASCPVTVECRALFWITVDWSRMRYVVGNPKNDVGYASFTAAMPNALGPDWQSYSAVLEMWLFCFLRLRTFVGFLFVSWHDCVCVSMGLIQINWLIVFTNGFEI